MRRRGQPGEPSRRSSPRASRRRLSPWRATIEHRGHRPAPPRPAGRPQRGGRQRQRRGPHDRAERHGPADRDRHPERHAPPPPPRPGPPPAPCPAPVATPLPPRNPRVTGSDVADHGRQPAGGGQPCPPAAQPMHGGQHALEQVADQRGHAGSAGRRCGPRWWPRVARAHQRSGRRPAAARPAARSGTCRSGRRRPRQPVATPGARRMSASTTVGWYVQ